MQLQLTRINIILIITMAAAGDDNDDELTLVLAAGRPNSNLRFLRSDLRLPPVARRLCALSRLIP